MFAQAHLLSAGGASNTRRTVASLRRKGYYQESFDLFGHMNYFLLYISFFTALGGSPVLAQSYQTLHQEYKVNDVICQNMSGTGWRNSCSARDVQGQQLVNMGAYLCGRRDWYPSKAAAKKAGCYGL